MRRFSRRERVAHWLLPLTSRILPEALLRFLNRHWRLFYDEADGWTYWLDVSYYRYVRKEQRQARHSC
jgi:hypothetical protein